MSGPTSGAGDGPAAPERAAAAAQRLRRRMWLLLAALLLLVALALAWSWSPLKQWLDLDRIVATLQRLGQAFGPAAAVGGFAVASALAVPLSFLILVTVVAYGTVGGFFCSLAGALIGSALSFGAGVLLGREVVLRLGGARLNRVSDRLARHGLLAVVAIRLVPIAPFAIVNMVMGSSQVRLHHMLLGTAVGMMPGLLATILFVDQIMRALKEPGPLTWLLVLLTLALIAAALWAFRIWIARIEREDGPAPAAAPGPPGGPARPPGPPGGPARHP